METDIDKLARERVLKARVELVMTRRFYGVLVSNVEPVPSRKFKTMATDGKRHYYNPDFIATLTQSQLLAVQAHEAEHDARHHHSRRNGRDLKKWNIAGDLAINPDLKEEGFDLPDWALFEEKYRGLSAEDIYRIRELESQQPQPQPELGKDKPEEGEGDDADDEQANGDGDADEGDDEAEGDEGDGGADEGDADEGEADEGDGGGDDFSDNQDGETGEGYAGSGDADEEAEAEGKGSGEGDEAEGDAGDGEGNGNGEAGEEAADEAAESAASSGDPGGCGEVIDAADDVGDLGESDSRWERIVRQAASLAKAVGQLPGHVTREIERANAPAQNWREVLRAWIDQGSRTLETWNRPNRRFVGRGLILPGKQRDGLNRVVFLIDTSGSMDDVALRCVNVEAQAALDDGAIDEAIVVYGDTQVTRVDRYHEGDEIVFDPRGGGGTDLRPLFRYVAEEIDDPSLIVCFTDLFIGDAGPEPSAPVLFAVTGYPQTVRELIANAPWGSPGIDVGEH